jgi:hypothetical protein
LEVPATTSSSCESASSVAVGFKQVLAVLVTDLGGADRALERGASQRERGGRADQGGDVTVDFRIQRHDRRDDLDFVLVVLREERTDRAVDQARDQRFLLGRTAFALEEATRDAATGVELFLVVDGEREEVLAFARRLAATAATSNTVPSTETMTAPPAWRAISPVSRV